MVLSQVVKFFAAEVASHNSAKVESQYHAAVSNEMVCGVMAA